MILLVYLKVATPQQQQQLSQFYDLLASPQVKRPLQRETIPFNYVSYLYMLNHPPPPVITSENPPIRSGPKSPPSGPIIHHLGPWQEEEEQDQEQEHKEEEEEE